jgi:hypothetical protein
MPIRRHHQRLPQHTQTCVCQLRIVSVGQTNSSLAARRSWEWPTNGVRPGRQPGTPPIEPSSADPKREKPLRCKGFRGTPGGTRTLNLLIRRSPSGVHSRPQPSTQPETTGFRFHGCPQPSTPVHSGWLPTWLPGEGHVLGAPWSSWPGSGNGGGGMLTPATAGRAGCGWRCEYAR